MKRLMGKSPCGRGAGSQRGGPELVCGRRWELSWSTLATGPPPPDAGCRVRACGDASGGRSTEKAAPDELRPSPKCYIYLKLSMVGDYPDVKCFGKNEENPLSSAT